MAVTLLRNMTTNPPISMPVSCPDCEARMPEIAAFCPGCGRSMRAVPAAPDRAPDKVGFMAENVAGAIAYLTFIPAVVFLLRKPYNTNRFVRFHAVQCLLLWASSALIALGLKVADLLLFIIPMAGPLFVVVVWVVVVLAAAVVWLVLVVKAAQGEMFKLPVLGDFAEQQANLI